MKKQLLLSVLFLFAATPQAWSGEPLTESKKNAIKHLIYLTGANKIGLQFADAVNKNLQPMMKKQYPKIPDRAFDIMWEEVRAAFESNMEGESGLISRFIPVYHKYFTEKELNEMISFYNTDTGKKVIKALPVLTQEGIAIGRTWSKEIMPSINQRLKIRMKKEGYLNK
ncbi:MAG: DUF2059 domain-containing protein [Magnetococcales bacterium]|nr:DUF2059 domain-containing protein [Magnetococcales bacterium]